ncbi:threonine--tRNA ligase [Candidatus Zinderia endosymbiont of Aphrophora alni]|uniref:threonine--tRNA ligase n=1 Tax=Candidatus Zinderia endosymbiont of Aphrophora alni TaxID=3077951 RepID=UPI0030CC875C
MITINLPKKKIFQTNKPISIKKIIKKLKIKKKILAAKINNKLVDLSFIINKNLKIKFITLKDKEGIKILRHSTAHLLANAIKELYPKSQIAIGPVINNGFYYDFYYKKKINKKDLLKIEKKMLYLSNKNKPIKKKILTYQEAINFFKLKKEFFKIKILKKKINNQEISIYTQGKFSDLCKGPHVSYTGDIKIFKLIKLSGAYWEGNSKNKMLYRIYGTAWENKKEQINYLNQLKELKKRDHRIIGKKLNLFHFQNEAPGFIFWHESGWIIREEIKKFMRKIYKKNNYKEIKTPEILEKILWKKTGHWQNYKKNMLIIKNKKKIFALKPMNCPGHIQMFNFKPKSYRELPIKYGEFGKCYRNETSGSLHGLMRVKEFTQDDGHIFCTKKQIQNEIINFHKIACKVYKKFGFKNIIIKLALRPKNRIGKEYKWDFAENELKKATNFFTNFKIQKIKGEGAFYGPKIEYHLQDSLGRYWQCGTIQIDLLMPKKLNVKYINKKNNYKTPIMLHRAIIGSLERFIAILIENYSGSMPLWLSPIQILILNISEKYSKYTLEIYKIFKKYNFRTKINLNNERINYKIKKSIIKKPFYIIIIGKKEYKTKTITIRKRKKNNFENISIKNFIKKIKSKLKNEKKKNI